MNGYKGAAKAPVGLLAKFKLPKPKGKKAKQLTKKKGPVLGADCGQYVVEGGKAVFKAGPCSTPSKKERMGFFDTIGGYAEQGLDVASQISRARRALTRGGGGGSSDRQRRKQRQPPMTLTPEGFLPEGRVTVGNGNGNGSNRTLLLVGGGLAAAYLLFRK